MDKKERKVQEAVGSLKVDETKKVYNVQYLGPDDRDPGFLLTSSNGKQIPLTDFDDVKSFFKSEAEDVIWEAFVPSTNNPDGDVIRDRVKHIEITIRITHTDE